MSREEKLDFIATRILAEDRRRQGLTSHRAIRETGILSISQYERRLSKEVTGNLNAHVDRGVFGRVARAGKRSIRRTDVGGMAGGGATF